MIILTKVIVIGDVEFRLARVMNVAMLSAIFFPFISPRITSCTALFSLLNKVTLITEESL